MFLDTQSRLHNPNSKEKDILILCGSMFSIAGHRFYSSETYVHYEWTSCLCVCAFALIKNKFLQYFYYKKNNTLFICVAFLSQFNSDLQRKYILKIIDDRRELKLKCGRAQRITIC